MKAKSAGAGHHRSVHTTNAERKREVIDASQVYLIKGKGGPNRGSGSGGQYWHIYAGANRVGYVFINIIQDKELGPHPSLQIHINQSQRGRHIGRVAYQLACEKSGYETVYAHMRKSNIASRKAAEEAGFEALDYPGMKQLSLKWQRQTAETAR